MEETLGKRIVAGRKGLGLTQDQLAERLGVTAQAVSKWENDQSCPDINMLPKLAEIFGTTTDALLGCGPQEKVFESEVIPAPEEPAETDGLHGNNGHWEFRWDGGKKSSIGLAVWVLLVGAQLLAINILQWDAGFWDLAWPTGLLVFGVFGLFPRFSFFRLGCGLLGGYYLLLNLHAAPAVLGKDILLPVFLLLFGLSLLFDALRKHRKNSYTISHNGKTLSGSSGRQTSSCDIRDESFDCNVAFGEETYYVKLPRLSGGSAGVSFGEMTVDLTGCEEITEGCSVCADCSFGELKILVPRWCRADVNTSKAFAAIDIKGTPDPDPKTRMNLEANVSFGEISIQYI